MDKKIVLTVLAVVVLLGIGLALASGWLGGEQGESSGGLGPAQVVLQGEGSTFIYPQIQAWSEEIKKTYPWITINYNPTGSGAGQSAFKDGVVDFAGSDTPLPREVWSSMQGNVIQIPVVIGMLAIVYNIPGLEDLRLDAKTIALIYKGEIEYWDDPRIASLNPGASLPHEKIVAVHRSDSSGTTHVLTIFLHKGAPDVWTEDLVGKSVDWPVDATGRGVGGKGNQGVMEVVKNTPYSIGYVEYAYVVKAGEGVNIALVANREGVFLKPSPEGAQAAASGAVQNLPDSPDDDWSTGYDAIIYAPGKDSYPITSWSFLLFYKQYSDRDKAEAVKKFIEWINTEGQTKVIEGYIPIPDEIRQINMKAVEMISYTG
ncbi:phosphate ABC transporter, phosphate binding protein [Aeropyrum pernix]|uniref:Phosphate-binding protein n=1 Tax=Aeropyrum pernix TaxID=56636 RepID=A0A401HBT0_AERPX|nr:phosphate ABC transporter substrate-binding protein PstS [Aeropyrum pernix]GBF09906.1 phosphate ABC transporter, phosphate binding protein [Aeropyrum pernix]